MPRRLVVIAVLVLAVAWAATALLTIEDDGGGEESPRYLIELDSAFGLTEGGEVRVGGVRAGKITKFRLDEEADPVKALVEVEINRPGFQRFRVDAGCDVRQQSLIGEYYVDCQQGRAKEHIPNGGRVKLANNSATIPLDLINNIQRLPYRERFRLFISHLGAGLAGRPDELNEVIRRAHPGLRETSEVIEILRQQNRYIANFIRDADTVSAAVEPRRDDVSRWAKEASETATIQASRADDLGRNWNRLPVFLAELEPTAAQLERTAGRQVGVLRALQDAAPGLGRLFDELGPFAESSHASTEALGEAAETGLTAIRESSDEIRQLRALARDAPRLGRPLRQFLQTIDDRSRSAENDPLARQTSPPAPDKTAYREGQGFTGMEALLNYFYYQTLGINAFDDIGHILRIVLISNQCSRYFTDPTPQERQRCGSGLGPNAPGLRNADGSRNPDPTTDGTAARERNQPRRRVGYRGPGEPEAPPVPGERDLSQPQFVLPPGVEGLVDDLNSPRGGSGDAAPGAPQLQALDFLLAP